MKSIGSYVNVDTARLKPLKIVYDGQEYELIVEKTVGKVSGKLVDGENVVTFVYRLVKKPSILDVVKPKEVKPNIPKTGDAIMGNAIIAWVVSVVSAMFGFTKLKEDEE